MGVTSCSWGGGPLSSGSALLWNVKKISCNRRVNQDASNNIKLFVALLHKIFLWLTAMLQNVGQWINIKLWKMSKKIGVYSKKNIFSVDIIFLFWKKQWHINLYIYSKISSRFSNRFMTYTPKQTNIEFIQKVFLIYFKIMLTYPLHFWYTSK